MNAPRSNGDTKDPVPGDLHTAARDAYLYGLPLIEMAALRARHLAEGAVQNAFFHMRRLSTHADRALTTPNNDTLYSFAWIDLSAGPVSLVVPSTGDRYWSVAVMSMFTDNEVVLGSRTVGSCGGRFTLVGPGQSGGGTDTVRVSTPHACVMLRTLVQDETDLAAAHRVQDGFSLSGMAAPQAPDIFPERRAPAEAYFAGVRKLLALTPPPPTDRALLRRCGALLEEPAAAHVRVAEVEGGVADAKTLLKTPTEPSAYINGWNYSAPNLGDFGQDYLYRARVAVRGLAALPAAEAMYLRAAGDDMSGVYTGDGIYRLRIPARLPLRSFWSLTLYEAVDGQFFLADNPIGRHFVGDRTRDLQRNADGSLDIWISRRDPGEARRPNWLPAPRSGPFALALRCYHPEPELMAGRWRLAPIERAD